MLFIPVKTRMYHSLKFQFLLVLLILINQVVSEETKEKKPCKSPFCKTQGWVKGWFVSKNKDSSDGSSGSGGDKSGGGTEPKIPFGPEEGKKDGDSKGKKIPGFDGIKDKFKIPGGGGGTKDGEKKSGGFSNPFSKLPGGGGGGFSNPFGSFGGGKGKVVFPEEPNEKHGKQDLDDDSQEDTDYTSETETIFSQTTDDGVSSQTFQSFETFETTTTNDPDPGDEDNEDLKESDSNDEEETETPTSSSISSPIITTVTVTSQVIPTQTVVTQTEGPKSISLRTSVF